LPKCERQLLSQVIVEGMRFRLRGGAMVLATISAATTGIMAAEARGRCDRPINFRDISTPPSSMQVSHLS